MRQRRAAAEREETTADSGDTEQLQEAPEQDSTGPEGPQLEFMIC